MNVFQRAWREPVDIGAAGDDGAVRLWPEKTLGFTVKPRSPGFPARQWLRLIAELDIGWQWRQEAGVGVGWMYRTLDDALRPAPEIEKTCCLELAGHGETWPRNAFARVALLRLAAPGRMRFSARVKARELGVESGGELVLEAGIYRRKPGRRDDDFAEPPDLITQIAIPSGSYEWQTVAGNVELPEDASGVLVRLGGHGFRGTLWAADIRLIHPNGNNALPPLARANPGQPAMNWVGENLSRKEWLSLALAVDGKTVFDGEVFHPGLRWPEIEIPLPDLSARGHRFELKLRATLAEPIALLVREAHLLRQSARPVEVLAYPQYPVAGRPFPVLLELNEANGPRLAVEKIAAGEPRAKPEYALKVAGQKLIIKPSRVVVSEADAGPWLSSGDFYHIAHEPAAFLNYLAWYARHRIGNAFGFRSSYQWTGARDTNPAAWQALMPLLQDLGLPYHLIMDGRHLAEAGRLNPPDSWLTGPGYRGRQTHELDSASYGVRRHSTPGTLFWDLFLRRRRETGIAAPSRYPWRDANMVDEYERYQAADMAQGHAQFVLHQGEHRGTATRHTGPSMLFRYFLEAGYDWIGAETMYGTNEVLLAAARGATLAAGKREFGAHVATQWSSAPHERPDRPLRHFLGLASAFLQGATDITSEDGAYRIEWYFAGCDRFSKACRLHRAAQRNFFRFLQTHPRRGRLRAPLAVLLGRDCGWDGWTRDRVWGSLRPEFTGADPERSFDLLQVLFPHYLYQGIYRSNCPLSPQGWFSGTPFGPVDLLPIDAPEKVLQQYAGALTLGWNTSDSEQAGRLRRFVEGGGNLLLAQPHLSAQAGRNPLPARADAGALRALLGAALPENGFVEAALGRGRLTIAADPVYPAHESLRAAYAARIAAVARLAAASEYARGWVEADADVEFAAYDWEDGRHRTIYLLNIDWWSTESAHAVTLRLGGAAHRIAARRGRIETITIADGVAVWADDATMDVMHVEAQGRRVQVGVQSDHGGRVHVMAGGTLTEAVIPAGGVQRLEVNS